MAVDGKDRSFILYISFAYYIYNIILEHTEIMFAKNATR